MRESIRTGLSFGLTSGVITTLGLLVGLSSGTNSRAIVIAGILTIAIADSFSDALGIHISVESEANHSEREIWESTIATFIAKFIFASLFIIPVVTFRLPLATIISIIFGLFVVGILSYFIAKQEDEPPLRVIREHVLVAIVVVIATHYSGLWIATMFN